MYNSQTELEDEMTKSGAERARFIIDKNNKEGRASLNSSSRGIFKQYVQVLSDKITADKAEVKPGPSKKYLKLLVGCEDITFAYLGVRTILAYLMQKQGENNARDLGRSVGKIIQCEQIFQQLKNQNQFDHHKFIERLEKAQSIDPIYRTKIAKQKLKDRYDIDPIFWGVKNQEEIGSYMIKSLVDLGMLDLRINKKRKGKKVLTLYTISLAEATAEYLDNSEKLLEEFQPLYMPLVEEPQDWGVGVTGGYHSERMKAVFNSPFIGEFKKGTESTLLESINALQKVKWKINTSILDTIKSMVPLRDFQEIIGPNSFNKPVFPTVIDKDKSLYTEDDKVIFSEWKNDTREWYTENKRRVQLRSRMTMAIRVAEKFRKENNIFFVYQADFRGRMYARSMGISPQGSDMQKALITFAEGKKLTDAKSVEWFLIHGANKYGIDKVPFADRVKWVNDNKLNIIQSSETPLECQFWKDADNPFQFLAWCNEYAEYEKYGEKVFESFLPISMDGSCNGLQNYSAAFRDIVGGKSTNLIDDVKPNDIYKDVASVVMKLLEEMPEDEKGFRSKWIKHIVNRKAVKRSVMTLPYGSTLYSCKEFIYNDYVRDVKPQEFGKKEWKPASNFLGTIVWKAISLVVIKAREAMKWLQESASKIIKSGEKVIEWETPSGYVVKQKYMSYTYAQKIYLALFDSQVKLYKPDTKASPKEHKNGIAPNFIHSLDSSHMQRVILRCKKEGINAMAMIHDDFGTHACYAEKFNQIIREEFVEMYQVDYFEKFYQRYKHLGINPPPKKGDLDINNILKSKYFFC